MLSVMFGNHKGGVFNGKLQIGQVEQTTDVLLHTHESPHVGRTNPLRQ